MRALILALLTSATPALAHHEVVVATSFLPVFLSAAAFVAAAGLGLRRKRKAKRKTDLQPQRQA